MKEIDYAAPKSIDEAVSLLQQNNGRARMLAGGTDIIVQLREYRRDDVEVLVDAKHIPETNELTYDVKNGLVIGAAVPCHKIYEDKSIAEGYPGLIDSVFLIGGIQIQSRASVGGNLCNASPAADTIPSLIAHKAMCHIAGPKGNRDVKVEDFCIAPGKSVLAPGEFLVSIHLPSPPERFGAAYLRFIPRNEMDIAVAGAGVSVVLDESKKRCSEARIALAAVAPTPLLVSEAGNALVGNDLNDALIDKAASLAQAAAKPITDMRGDIEYRKHLVGVLTKRSLMIAIERAGNKTSA